MKTALEIVLIALGSYILLLVFDLVFVFIFRSILKRHERGFTIVLNTKLNNINNLFNFMKKNDVVLDEKYIELIASINPHDFDHQDTKECQIAREKILTLRTYVTLLCNEHKELTENEELKLIRQNIKEQDKIYHNYVAMYNADVLGYNYWIRFYPCRFIFLLLDIKTKDII